MSSREEEFHDAVERIEDLTLSEISKQLELTRAWELGIVNHRLNDSL